MEINNIIEKNEYFNSVIYSTRHVEHSEDIPIEFEDYDDKNFEEPKILKN